MPFLILRRTRVKLTSPYLWKETSYLQWQQSVSYIRNGILRCHKGICYVRNGTLRCHEGIYYVRNGIQVRLKSIPYIKNGTQVRLRSVSYVGNGTQVRLRSICVFKTYYSLIGNNVCGSEMSSWRSRRPSKILRRIPAVPRICFLRHKRIPASPGIDLCAQDALFSYRK